MSSAMMVMINVNFFMVSLVVMSLMYMLCMILLLCLLLCTFMGPVVKNSLKQSQRNYAAPGYNSLFFAINIVDGPKEQAGYLFWCVIEYSVRFVTPHQFG